MTSHWSVRLRTCRHWLCRSLRGCHSVSTDSVTSIRLPLVMTVSSSTTSTIQLCFRLTKTNTYWVLRKTLWRSRSVGKSTRALVDCRDIAMVTTSSYSIGNQQRCSNSRTCPSIIAFGVENIDVIKRWFHKQDLLKWFNKKGCRHSVIVNYCECNVGK